MDDRKDIDAFRIGDRVVMHMTGDLTRYVGECVSTKEKPEPKTRVNDHPRFKIVGALQGPLPGSFTEAPEDERTLLRPGDYIIMEDCYIGGTGHTERDAKPTALESACNSRLVVGIGLGLLFLAAAACLLLPA